MIIPRSPTRRLPLRFSLIIAIAACGGAASPAPATPSASGGDGTATDDAAALAFFQAQIERCNQLAVEVGNSAPGEKFFDGGDNDPTVKVDIVERPGAGKVVIADRDGARLLIDVTAKTISDPAGAGTPVAVRYQTCQPEVFVGPAQD